jgi:hypothetical protein
MSKRAIFFPYGRGTEILQRITADGNALVSMIFNDLCSTQAFVKVRFFAFTRQVSQVRSLHRPPLRYRVKATLTGGFFLGCCSIITVARRTRFQLATKHADPAGSACRRCHSFFFDQLTMHRRACPPE